LRHAIANVGVLDTMLDLCRKSELCEGAERQDNTQPWEKQQTHWDQAGRPSEKSIPKQQGKRSCNQTQNPALILFPLPAAGCDNSRRATSATSRPIWQGNESCRNKQDVKRRASRKHGLFLIWYRLPTRCDVNTCINPEFLRLCSASLSKGRGEASGAKPERGLG